MRDEVLPALGLTVTAAAKQLRVSRQTLHSILAERSAVSPEMALRLGKFCGNGPTFWLRLQEAHSLWHAERALRADLSRIPRHSSTDLESGESRSSSLPITSSRAKPIHEGAHEIHEPSPPSYVRRRSRSAPRRTAATPPRRPTKR